MRDAHVHMGYYPRMGHEVPFYYSPSRILGVMNRCGIREFVVSSTCAQIADISRQDILREAKEMKRVAGVRAHVFFWLSGRLYDEDRGLRFLETGLFEGIKLHERETPWNSKRKNDLERIVAIAEERQLPVQFHCGGPESCMPLSLAKIAEKFPRVHFDFAHCNPMRDMAKVVARLPNVWTDTACLRDDDWNMIFDLDWHGRLLFGTDFPAYHSKIIGTFTGEYKKIMKRFLKDADAAFNDYLARR